MRIAPRHNRDTARGALPAHHPHANEPAGRRQGESRAPLRAGRAAEAVRPRRPDRLEQLGRRWVSRDARADDASFCVVDFRLGGAYRWSRYLSRGPSG